MKKVFRKARLAKDRNFDGRFYFAVKTTGIFCRPSCPAPIAKEENVLYFKTIFEALEKGFRPCLRCRPDITTEYFTLNPAGADLVQSALHLIYDGYLHRHSIADLAASLSVSERHLRKLFVDNLGASPVKIDRYHKAIFAKRLVVTSSQPITDIAFASGFRSLRQFNEVFKKMFAASPTEMRRRSAIQKPVDGETAMSLKYSAPFDFSSLLSFLKPRAIRGVEVVTHNSYSRTFRTGHADGFFTVTDNPVQSRLELKIDSTDPRCYMTIHNRVRRMFDLDTDFAAINAQLGSDPLLRKGMMNDHVPRLPVAFDPFEFAIRAILGQQISVKAATTLAGRVAANAAINAQEGFPEGLDMFFPNPEELLTLEFEGTGITRSRQNTLKTITRAVIDGTVLLTRNQSPETFHRSLSAIKGIGDWTINYVAMRGLGMQDSFPYSDLGVRKALTTGNASPTKKEILALAEKWRPYRTYATLCLWNHDQENKQ